MSNPEQDLEAFLPGAVISWQRRAGRHDLPWQNTRDPYAIWISEIMLQQTQVTTVLGYYPRFLTAFPDVKALARAPLETVLEHWSGLGYYSRARNLHAAARRIVLERGGRFPTDPATLATLPGIGRSTAAAIAVFSEGRRAAILDGNVKRVLSRAFARAGSGGAALTRELWTLAEAMVPERDVEAYTQGLMDLGATVCLVRKPRCASCPLQTCCLGYAAGNPEQFPARTAARVVPERRAVMLFLHHAGDVLLERRPAPGIWGGLWSLPQWDGATPVAPVEAFARQYGAIATVAALPSWRHSFTHFTLEVDMVAIDLRHVTGRLRPGDLWLSLSDVRGAALPAPIKKLLWNLWQVHPASGSDQ